MAEHNGSTTGIAWVYNDGGRAAAGFRGETGDCVTRAIAIATKTPYQDVYAALNHLAQNERRYRGRRSSARTGVFKKTYKRYLQTLGPWAWMPTMRIGQGCTVHLRTAELPGGRLIVKVSKHLVAVIDGVVHDTHDPSRDGMRCVYGWWAMPSEAR